MTFPVDKLIIGGAQFGFKYGVSPDASRVEEAEIGKILDFADQQGIRFIDTARVYGESEEVIGRKAGSDFSIVSKCIVRPGQELPGESVRKSLQVLGRETLYGYLIHGPEFLFEVPRAWDDLKEVKEKGLVQKIGFSLYKPELLFKLIDAGMQPDLIQIQYNVLDRRFEAYFESLRLAGVEIHARSAFIQGLFFLDELPDYLVSLKGILNEINELYPDKRERAAALLSFCAGNSGIDKVVIGLNRKDELELNISHFITPQANKLFKLDVPEIHDEVLLPYNWPIYRPKA